MNPESQHNQIMFMLGEIKSDVRGIKDHLGTLNGKVAAHEIRLNDNDIDKSFKAGKIKVWVAISGFIGAFIAVLAKFLLDKFFK